MHALCNALCSAVGKGSLGEYADKMCEKGIKDSKEYVKEAHSYVKKAGHRINNVSIAVEAKRPRLEKYTADIKRVISRLLGLKPGMIGLTFTSGEGLTAFGRGEGIQAFAIVTIKNDN